MFVGRARHSSGVIGKKPIRTPFLAFHSERRGLKPRFFGNQSNTFRIFNKFPSKCFPNTQNLLNNFQTPTRRPTIQYHTTNIRFFDKLQTPGERPNQIISHNEEEESQDVPKNIEEVFQELKRKVEEEGEAEEMYNLATLYFFGQGVEKSNNEAMKYLKKAADLGSPKAQYHLATLYKTGEEPASVEDIGLACYYYKLAAQNGNVDAKFAIADIYFTDYDDKDNLLNKSSNDINMPTSLPPRLIDESSSSLQKHDSNSKNNKNKNKNNMNDKTNSKKKTSKSKKHQRNQHDDNEEAENDDDDDGRYDERVVDRPIIPIEPQLALQYLQEAAEQGICQAQYKLGLLYYLGFGDTIVVDKPSAFLLLHSAADHPLTPHHLAQFLIATMYYHGDGVEKDLTMALHYSKLCADAGIVRAQYNLALLYHHGETNTQSPSSSSSSSSSSDRDDSIPRNLRAAVHYYKLAAEKNHVPSMYALVSFYFEYEMKDLVPLSLALSFLRRLADHHACPISAYNLGYLFASGDKGVSKDDHLAIQYYKLASEAGYTRAQYALGRLLADQRPPNYSLAFHYFSLAAEPKINNNNDNNNNDNNNSKSNNNNINSNNKGEEDEEEENNNNKFGHSAAQFWCGHLLQSGLGVKQDIQKALQYYRRAIKQGNDHAMYDVATMYHFGKGVNVDIPFAVELYHSASSRGHRLATYNLGLIYKLGEGGITVNPTSAFRLFKLASDLHLLPARFQLANCYLNGFGVEKDESKALSLYCNAADLGFADAQFGAAVCLLRGSGTVDSVPDRDRAIKYLTLASQQLHPRAIQLLRSLSPPSSCNVDVDDDGSGGGNVKNTPSPDNHLSSTSSTEK